MQLKSAMACRPGQLYGTGHKHEQESCARCCRLGERDVACLDTTGQDPEDVSEGDWARFARANAVISTAYNFISACWLAHVVHIARLCFAEL